MAKAKARTTKRKRPAAGKKVKGGHAQDVAPDRVEGEEASGLAVPIADGKGGQRGRTPPGQRRYVARYEAVSAAEAQRRMMARTRGDMPTIEGGLDDNELPDEVAEELRMTEKDASGNFDPLGGSPEPGDEALVEEEKALAQQPAMGMVEHPVARGPVETKTETAVYTVPSPMEEYMAQRCRVTLELVDGSMSLSAVDVKQSRYGVTILLPLLDEGVTFIPKPGSEITVSESDRSWNCYFPGTHFEVPELKLLGLVFVKKDEDNNG